MKIGELAVLANTPVETIRFYEREALLPPAGRTAGNYRIYEAGDAERLAFIRHCRSLDMTLGEIRALLRLRDAPTQTCAEVNELLDAHIGHVADRMRELRILEKQLKALREHCRARGTISECGILNQLTQEAGTGNRGPKPKSHIQGAHGANV